MIFKNKKLGRTVNDDNLMYKEFGKKRAHKLKVRLSELLSVVTMEDFKHLPGNYHKLNNERNEQWACDLDKNHQLIFKPIANPVPEDNDEKSNCSEIKAISILEIINHHKEQ